MLGYAMVDAFMRGTCASALERLKCAIAKVDGLITEVETDATRAVQVNVELEAGSVALFAEALEAEDVHLLEACMPELAKAKLVVPSTKPLTALVHVTLVT